MNDVITRHGRDRQMPALGAHESWASVLAGAEDEMRGAETLLAASTAAVEPTMPTLPDEVVPSVGPDIARMPAIPDELLVRAAELRDRIAALRVELAAAREHISTPIAPVVRLHADSTPAAAEFVIRAG